MRAAALLGFIGAIGTATYLWSFERTAVDKAVDDALSSGPHMPTEALKLAQMAPFVIVPVLAFLMVYFSVSCASHCLCAGSSDDDVPMGLPVVASGVHYQDFASARSAPPPRTGQFSDGRTEQFSDGVCACANDPKLCLVTLCCPSVTIAQLWVRAMASSRGIFFAVFVPLALCSIIVAAAQQECPSVECRPGTHNGELPQCRASAPQRDAESPLCSLAGSAQTLAGLAAVALLVIVRCAPPPATSYHLLPRV